eukprot:358595-Chlamydomonas_euryale.AAC.7
MAHVMANFTALHSFQSLAAERRLFSLTSHRLPCSLPAASSFRPVAARNVAGREGAWREAPASAPPVRPTHSGPSPPPPPRPAHPRGPVRTKMARRRCRSARPRLAQAPWVPRQPLQVSARPPEQQQQQWRRQREALF